MTPWLIFIEMTLVLNSLFAVCWVQLQSLVEIPGWLTFPAAVLWGASVGTVAATICNPKNL